MYIKTSNKSISYNTKVKFDYLTILGVHSMTVWNESLRNLKISWRWDLWDGHVGGEGRHRRKGNVRFTFKSFIIQQLNQPISWNINSG